MPNEPTPEMIEAARDYWHATKRRIFNGGTFSDAECDIVTLMASFAQAQTDTAVRDAVAAEKGECRWVYDDGGGVAADFWEGSCGEAFCFEFDGPKENKYKFCPNCGCQIKIAAEIAGDAGRE